MNGWKCTLLASIIIVIWLFLFENFFYFSLIQANLIKLKHFFPDSRTTRILHQIWRSFDHWYQSLTGNLYSNLIGMTHDALHILNELKFMNISLASFSFSSNKIYGPRELANYGLTNKRNLNLIHMTVHTNIKSSVLCWRGTFGEFSCLCEIGYKAFESLEGASVVAEVWKWKRSLGLCHLSSVTRTLPV